MISAFAFPLFEKFLQELLHNFMTVLGQLFAGFGEHTILQEQKFFVKVIDGWAVTVFVGLERVVLFRRLIWVVHGPTFSTTVCKCPANADCTNCIQFVGIMDNFAFNGLELRFNICTFKRYITDYIFYVLDDVITYLQALKPFSCRSRASFFVTIVELPVGYIVQKGGQLDCKCIRIWFISGNMLGDFPGAVHVPIIMSGTFGTKFIFKKGPGLEDNFCLCHALILAERLPEKLAYRHKGVQPIPTEMLHKEEFQKIKSGTFLYLLFKMVRSLDRLWNQFEPDLYRLQEKLERAGLALINGEVTYIEEDKDNV